DTIIGRAARSKGVTTLSPETLGRIAAKVEAGLQAKRDAAELARKAAEAKSAEPGSPKPNIEPEPLVQQPIEDSPKTPGHPLTAISAGRAGMLNLVLSCAPIAGAVWLILHDPNSIVFILGGGLAGTVGIFFVVSSAKYFYLAWSIKELFLYWGLSDNDFTWKQRKKIAKRISITHSSLALDRKDLQQQYQDLTEEQILPSRRMREKILPTDAIDREKYLEKLKNSAFYAYTSLNRSMYANHAHTSDMLSEHESYKNHFIGMLAIMPGFKLLGIAANIITCSSLLVIAYFLGEHPYYISDMHHIFISIALVFNIFLQLLLAARAAIFTAKYNAATVKTFRYSAISAIGWNIFFLVLANLENGYSAVALNAYSIMAGVAVCAVSVFIYDLIIETSLAAITSFFSYSSLAAIVIYLFQAEGLSSIKSAESPIILKAILAILSINILSHALVFGKNLIKKWGGEKDRLLRFSAISIMGWNSFLLMLFLTNPYFLSPVTVMGSLVACILSILVYRGIYNTPRGTLKNFFSYSSLAGIAIYSIAAGNIKGPLAFKGILAILAINILLQILIYAKDVVQNPPRGKDDFLRFSAFSAAALNILFLILHSINPAILSPMIIIAGISICAILPFFNYISKNNKPKATGEDPAFEVGTVLALILLVTIPVVSLKTYMSLKGVPALIHIAAKQERSRHLTLEMYEDLRRSWAIEILKNKDRVNSAPHIVESLYRVDDDTGAVLSSMLDEINWKPHSLNEEILYLIGKESESSYTNGLPGIIAIGKEAVIPLLQILGKEDISKDCKLNVIRTLAGIGDKGATNCLVTLFTEVNEDRRVRCGAANALGAIKDASAVPSLIEALKEGDGEIRESSEKALVEIDDASAVTPLIEMLKDKNAEIRKVAAKILGKLGDQRAVGPLTDMLEKGDVWEVSYAAMGSLSELNVLPEALIVKTYIRDLRSKDSEYAARPTIEALGRMGSPAVPALTEELKNGKNVWREDVVKALGSIGDGRAIAPLIEVLRDDSNDLRKAAVEALSKFGESAIPLLVEALKNESATVRKHAAEVLDKLNWEPQTESEEKAYLLAKADLAMLLKAGDEQAIRFIEEALKDKNVSVRISIVCTLSSAGRPAVQYLVEKLKDENSGVREVAVRGLGEIGDPQTIQSLIDVLRDKESYVRVSAVKALGKIGDKRAMQPLSERLSDADSNVRLSAVKALARFPDAQVVSGLVKALSDKNQPVCEAAAESVKEMKAVPQLLGELTRAYDKNDRETINMIENALTVIDKPALLKWKQDRFSKHMPQLAEYIKWAGIGMILFVALGAIAWVLAKILRLKARASKDDSTHPFTAISAKRAAVISSALAGASVTAAASALFCNHDSMVWLAAASIFVAAGVFIALATVRYLFLSRATERELAAALIKRGFSPGQAKILSRYISITHSSINYSSINHWQPDIKAQYDNLKPEYILPDSEMRKALLPGNPAAREAYLTTLREAAFDAFQ
ncbi:MAG: HEAT repeat domain-containing protein, partial [Candidatus Omnitrophica bacterium]|nr:HEAT repeat domain-containing protein [Candidatus Omnitrophota bacterium]